TDGGANFEKPIRIDEGKAIGRVDLVMVDKDNAMVSWMEGTDIKAVKVNRDGSKGTPVVIASTSDSRSSGFPQMTKSGNELVFAWTDDTEKKVKVASIKL
ncbi:MAG: exo-alpha-sialidase, partial [Cyclobacteriaceae bacterium]